MPYLVDVQPVFPEYKYSQKEIKDRLKTIWNQKMSRPERLDKILDNVLVDERKLSMPIEKYFEKMTFGERNDVFIEVAVDLAEKASRQILDKYNIDASEISSLWSNTVTGFAIPSLDARLMNRLNFKPNTKRMPLLGLGCMAGVSGINRVSDYLKAYPKEVALFFSVELCSMTFQIEDISLANIISTCLFGDGAAAVLLVGDEHPLASKAQLKWIGSESVFFPNTEDMMGWKIDETGLSIQLSKSVPQITEVEIPKLVKKFLEANQLSSDQIHSYFAHPGGPKVLLAMEQALNLEEGALHFSWDSLKANGNMSSVSVLDILHRHLRAEEKIKSQERTYSMSIAMGPAFSAEVGLFKWNYE